MRQGDLFKAESDQKALETLTFAAGVRLRQRRHRPGRTRDPATARQRHLRSQRRPARLHRAHRHRGNTRTLDRVIRREMRAAEGDAYNRVLLDGSKNRIRALGFFDEKTSRSRGGRLHRTAPSST